jgi:hypothetical protein
VRQALVAAAVAGEVEGIAANKLRSGVLMKIFLAEALGDQVCRTQPAQSLS